MSKRKRGARRTKPRPPDEEASGKEADSHQRWRGASPPRRNFPLLAVSVILLIVWFAYLAYVAWKVTVTSQ